jgi:energy-coupling factor transporter ATP-binding protein EcfA2
LLEPHDPEPGENRLPAMVEREVYGGLVWRSRTRLVCLGGIFRVERNTEILVGVVGVTIVGREDLLAAASTGLADAGSVLLLGAAGAGKSTVLAALSGQLHSAGVQVLSAAPAESDAGLPFLTLIDLLTAVPGRLFDQLGPGSRRAVDAALLKQEVPQGDLDQLAVRVGVLDLLRQVARDAPTALVIDDVQWADAASAEVLSFVARRLTPGSVRMLGVERVAEGDGPRCRDLLPEGAVELQVGPLPDDVLAELLLDRANGLVTRPIAKRICELAAGSPLFALEIADALVRRGALPGPGEELPVPAQLEALMRQRLASMTDSARDTVRVAASAARPTVTLLGRAGCASPVADLSAAAPAGVATLGVDGAVTFAHPLLRAAVYAEAPVAVRMRVHERLADAVSDPIERARHLAMATAAEDEPVAAALTEAAVMARRRGAASTAFELAGLAAQRTPSMDSSAWAERKIAQGWHAYAAGLIVDAQQAAQQVLAAN